MRAIDPSPTLVVHCGIGFDARFEPYQVPDLSGYNAIAAPVRLELSTIGTLHSIKLVQGFALDPRGKEVKVQGGSRGKSPPDTQAEAKFMEVGGNRHAGGRAEV
jgi:hypothetical protein